ncbi:MAG: diadenylate cyclase CdaA [Flavobacteriales bacterium]
MSIGSEHITLFITFRWIDLLDIFIVAYLLYRVYYLMKGTTAISIFLGILIFYSLWLLVKALNMQLLSTILGQFIGVGMIALIVVFQQEIRRFLLMVGSRGFFNKDKFRGMVNIRSRFQMPVDYEAVARACQQMALSKTGALIVITHRSELKYYVNSGVSLNARLSADLLESIFFKNNPLHDGAVIIYGDTIKAAKCVLPLTENNEFPPTLGLRHRAAVGITEQSDAIAICVSEQTGEIAFAKNGELRQNITPSMLTELLKLEFE